MSQKPAPFIIKSEVKDLNDADVARRQTLMSLLSPEEVDEASGATNYPQPNFCPDWSPDHGGDAHKCD